MEILTSQNKLHISLLYSSWSASVTQVHKNIYMLINLPDNYWLQFYVGSLVTQLTLHVPSMAAAGNGKQ
jgi:hypothetical protein